MGIERTLRGFAGRDIASKDHQGLVPGALLLQQLDELPDYRVLFGEGVTPWKELMSAAHLWISWALAAAFAAHLAGVAKHTFIDRDGLLRRMAWKAAPPTS